MKLKCIMFITALVMLVLLILGLLRYRIDTPREMHQLSPRERSIVISGLPRAGDFLLSKSLIMVVACVLILFFCLLRLDKSLTNEHGVLRLRRYLRIYGYLLFVFGLLIVAQIALALIGLFTVQHISLAHVLHSRLLDGIMGSCVFVSHFFYTHGYIRAIQEAPPSVILAAKARA